MTGEYRMTIKTLAALFLCTASIAGNALAEVTNKAELPARVELHAVPTVWITDQQFLTGDDKAGKPITVGVELRIAQAKGKTPLVVLMHGSSGIGGNVPFWARELNAMGISTLTIDGMSGRGLQGVGENQALIGRLNFIVDIYRSLEVVAKHPRIDTSRVALMGFSRGGQAALYASVQRFQKQWNKSGVDFVAYIPFYPDCATTYDGDTDTGAAPIRIFHGAPDNYNPVASCKKFIARLKDAKRDVELTEYPNAQHGFDNPIAPTTPVLATNSQSVRDCTIKETAPGTLTNTETSAPFTFKDACVKLSPLVGADPEATDAARIAVKAFLKTTFKLE
jgi:dienelactone hydrolase